MVCNTEEGIYETDMPCVSPFGMHAAIRTILLPLAFDCAWYSMLAILYKLPRLFNTVLRTLQEAVRTIYRLRQRPSIRLLTAQTALETEAASSNAVPSIAL